MFKFKCENEEVDVCDDIIITPEDVEKINHFNEVVKDIEKKISPDEKLDISKDTYIDYKSELNSAQLAAVVTTENPLLIIAGAGSGKTRTLTYRVAYMLEKNIRPENILLLTFTRKAANEMMERTRKLLNKSDFERKITAGTFHAFANNMLRRYSGLTGIKPNFSILDTADSEDIIDLVKKDMKIEKKGRAFPRKGTIVNIISRARNSESKILNVINKEYPFTKCYFKEINILKEKYESFKKEHNQLDYDDLLEKLLYYLQVNKEFKDALQFRYKYIMVDEFQDTNAVQNKIVNELADKNRNLMVVGDDTQSIYAFRGANYENIFTFPKTYPDCKVIKLEENYRSKQDILDFTNRIIENFHIAYKKKLFSKNYIKGQPEYKRFYSADKEAEWVAEKIFILLQKKEKPENIAVLYRATFHGNNLQTELLRLGVDFTVYGGLKFTERRHIKDMLGYLRVLQNHKDAVSWNRILKVIPGIGVKTAANIIEEIVNKNEINTDKYKKKKFYEKLNELVSLYSGIVQNKELALDEIVKKIREYYEPILKELEADFDQRQQDLKIFEQMVQKEKSLERFLTKFALDPPNNKIKNRNTPGVEEELSDKITLSTIHSAKGLEWKHVFVIGLLDGLFPAKKCSSILKDIEEERRLFYVACTRAKDSLFLTCPGFYYSYDEIFNADSRFVIEVLS